MGGSHALFAELAEPAPPSLSFNQSIQEPRLAVYQVGKLTRLVPANNIIVGGERYNSSDDWTSPCETTVCVKLPTAHGCTYMRRSSILVLLT